MTTTINHFSQPAHGTKDNPFVITQAQYESLKTFMNHAEELYSRSTPAQQAKVRSWARRKIWRQASIDSDFPPLFEGCFVKVM